MKITIDTKEDSPEDIRKTVAFLSSLADGAKEHHSNIFEDSGSSLDLPGADSESSPEPAGGNAFANMFGGDSDNTPVLPVTETSSEDDPDQDSPDEEETAEDAPEIMEY